MTYCKDYCEEKGISTSKLNEAQKTLYYIAENMKMGKSINEEGYKHFQMAIKALEQEPCEDWCDVPSDEMTLEQARQAVKDLRKFVMDNHILPKFQYCEDCISRQAVLDLVNADWKSDENLVSDIANLPPVTLQLKTGQWI